MGRHANDTAGDEGWDDPDGTPPRHVAAGEHPLEPQAVISPDTHVGGDFDELAAGTPDAEPSPANPDALVEQTLRRLRDKKRAGDDINLVLLGVDGPIVETRPADEVRAALDTLIVP